jgi:toxin ParE1/3/4
MVRLTRRAESDLAGIADSTIQSFGIEQARRYIAGLEACFHTLGGKPSKGRSAEELAPRLRRFRYKSHVVFFIPGGEGVLIVRVLHQSMDFQRHL